MKNKILLKCLIISILVLISAHAQEQPSDCDWFQFYNTDTSTCIDCFDDTNGGIAECSVCYYIGGSNQKKAQCQACGKGFNIQNVQNICTKWRRGQRKDPTVLAPKRKYTTCPTGCNECDENLNCYECQYTYVMDTQNKVCLSCQGDTGVSNCTRCSLNQTNEIVCNECNYDWQHNNYRFVLTTTNTCKACSDFDPICTRCNETQCTVCNWNSHGYYLNPSPQPSQGFPVCHTCSNIDSLCTQCTVIGTTKTCTQCSGNQYGVVSVLQNNQCKLCNLLSVGTTGQKCNRCGIDNSNLICLECDYCQSCGYGGYLSGQTCKSCHESPHNNGCQFCSQDSCRQCHTGYYFDDNNVCKACNDVAAGGILDCASCQSHQNDTFFDVDTVSYIYKQQQFRCYYCSQGKQYNYYTNECTTCNWNQYKSGSNCTLCSATLPGCNQCVTSQGSLKCFSCQDGYYLDVGTKHCIKCSVTFPGCQSCYYTSNIYGYIIDVISQGNQANTLRCYTCIKPDDYVNALYNGCKSCSDVPNGGILKCDQCFYHRFLKTVQCNHCKDGNVLVLNICQLCEANQYEHHDGYCADCNMSEPNCNECINNFPSPTQPVNCNGCLNSYFFLEDNKCKTCDSPDLELDGECATCSFDGKNLNCSQCKEGFYLDYQTQSCERCIANCSYCYSSDNCYKCKAPYKMNPYTSKCSICSNGSYDNDQGVCKSCISGIANCVKCYKFEGKPVQCLQCLEGFTEDPNGACQSCQAATADLNCLKCNGTKCSECKKGTFLDQETNTCKFCSEYQNCFLCDRQNCRQCQLGYNLVNGQCQICNSSQFEDQDTGECLNCNDAIIGCQSCYKKPENQPQPNVVCDGELNEYNPVQGICVNSNCSSSQYFDYKYYICMSCQDTCDQCKSQSQCMKCKVDPAKEYTLVNGSCINRAECNQNSNRNQDCTCIEGFYNSQGYCSKCSTGCLQCTDNQTCILCNLDYYKFYDSCISISECGGVTQNNTVYNELEKQCKCQQGYYTHYGQCMQCNENQNCLQCKYENQQQICIQCVQNQYLDKYNQCQQCRIEFCQLCSKEGGCQSCQKENYLWSNNCLKKCPQGTTMNKLKLICECNVGTYEYNNECVSICPAPTLVSSDNKKCISNLQQIIDQSIEQANKSKYQCIYAMNGFEIITSRSIDNTIDISSLPIKCSVFIPNCSSCYSKQNYSSNNQEIICENCIEGFTGFNQDCVECSKMVPNCQSCDGSNCYQCKQGYLYSQWTHQCIKSTCKINEYQDASSNCQQCSQKITNCKLCSFDQQSQTPVCLQCLTGYYSTKKGNCLACTSNCATCKSGALDSICIACAQGYYLGSDNKCYSCNNATSGILNCEVCSSYQKSNNYPPQEEEEEEETGQDGEYSEYSEIEEKKKFVFDFNPADFIVQPYKPICYVCKLGYYYIPVLNQCSQCKINQYYSSTSKTCKSCNQTDQFCSSCIYREKANQILCLGCQSGFYLDSLSVCKSCSAKFSGCLECNENVCFQCNSDSYLKQNSSIASTDFINDGESTLIPPDDSDTIGSCQTCESLIQNCEQCYSGIEYVQGNQDYSTGEQQSYSYILNICLTCKKGFSYDPILNKCVNCQESEYITPNGICISCQEAIQGCDFCIYEPQYQSPICLQCQSGMIYDEQSKQCQYIDQYIEGCEMASNYQGLSCDYCELGYGYVSNSNINTSKCIKCQEGCIDCDYTNINKDPSQQAKLIQICRQCAKNSFLTAEGTCSQCPNGQYLNQAGTQCINCPTNLTKCTQCTLKESTVQCIECSQGYFLNDKGICVACSTQIPNCTGCSKSVGHDFIFCYACAATFSNFDGTCQPNNCIAGENTNCAFCSIGYDGESKQNISVCSVCLPGFQIFNGNKKMCHNCKTTQYYDQVSSSCLNCSTLFANCDACEFKKVYKTTVCTSCLKGFYPEYSPVSGQCKPCQSKFSNCLECEIDNHQQPYCTVCKDGYFTENGSACTACSSKISGCQLCHHHNKELTYNEYMELFVSYEKLDLFIQNNFIQISIYNSNFDLWNYRYQNQNSNSLVCDTCQPSTPYYNHYKNNCQSCLDYEILQDDQTCATCQSKINGCRGCSKDGAQPVQCFDCYPGFYLNSQNTCSPCTGNCKNCKLTFSETSSTFVEQCLECFSPFNINPLDGTCSNCANYQYLNPVSSSCQNCDQDVPNCKSCIIFPGTKAAFCSSCFEGYILDERLNECVPCSNFVKNCQNCQQIGGQLNSGIVCLSCNKGYEINLLEQNCSECKTWEYLKSDGTCSVCSISNCLVCNANSSQCLECNKGLFTKTGNTQICWDKCNVNYAHCEKCNDSQCLECSSGFFLDPKTKQCTACSTKFNNGCSQCSSTQCLSCDEGFILNIDKNTFNNVCQPCDITCSYCSWDLNSISTLFQVPFEFVSDFYIQMWFDMIRSTITYEQNYVQQMLNMTTQLAQKCVVCAKNYAFSYLTQKCELLPVDQSCGAQNCLSCTIDKQYYLNDNSEDYLVCEECVDGMMPDGNDCTVADEQCVEALPNCFKCQVNQLTGLDECAICDEGYILVSNNLQLYQYGSFQFEQLEPFYADYHQTFCVAKTSQKSCPIGCKTCTMDPDTKTITCLTCINSNYSVSQGACKLTDCTTIGLENCDKCVELQIDTVNGGYKRVVPYCQQCSTGYSLLLGECKQNQECTDGETFNVLLQICQDCGCDFCISTIYDTQSMDKTSTNYQNAIVNGISYGSGIYQVLECKVCTIPNCVQCDYDQISQSFTCLTCKYDTPMDNSDNCNVDCATNGVLNISNCSKCFALSNTVVKCQICDTNYKMNSLGVCIDVAAAALACQSDQYYNVDETACVDCSIGCAKCYWNDIAKQSVCQYCKDSDGEDKYYQLNRSAQCIFRLSSESHCPIGFYDNTDDSSCDQCPQFCDVCFKNLSCQTCQLGYKLILDDSTNLSYCISSDPNAAACPVNQYQFNNKCYYCPRGCSDCNYISQAVFCSACINDTEFYLDTVQGKCMSTICQNQQYFNIIYGCLDCPQFCSKCRQASTGEAICLECLSTKYQLVAGKCQFDNANAANCVLHCDVCANEFECTTCSASYTLDPNQKQCSLTSCNPGEFYNQKTDLCVACGDNCALCNYNFNQQIKVCTSCSNGYDLIEGRCYEQQLTCTSSQYPQKAIINGKLTKSCQTCPLGCSSCYQDLLDYSKIYCTSCSGVGLELSKSKCQFKNSLTLITGCVATEFADYITNACVSCSVPRSQCTKCVQSKKTFDVTCLECAANYQPIFGKCVRSCNIGQFPTSSDSFATSTCQNCNERCLNCQYDFNLNKELCLQCNKGYHLDQGVCIVDTVCNSDEYTIYLKSLTSALTQDQFCIDCPVGTTFCFAKDQNNILSEVISAACTSTYTLTEQGLCVETFWLQRIDCTDGEFQVVEYNNGNKEWTCRPCTYNQSHCNVCHFYQGENTTDLDCLECYQDYIIKTDPITLYGTCLPIPTCKTYPAQYTFQVNAKPSFTCNNCPANCDTCKLDKLTDNTTVKCQTCKDANNFKISFYGTCAKVHGNDTKCPTGQFRMILMDLATCQQCSEGCSECYQVDVSRLSSPTTCNTCAQGYSIFNTTRKNVQVKECKRECAQDNFLQALGNTFICQQCNLACQKCTGPSDKECLSCAQGYILNEQGQCEIVPPLPEDCGTEDAYLIKRIQKCQCVNDGYLYLSDFSGKDINGDPKVYQKVCVPITDWAKFISGCSQGTYKNGANCDPCYSSSTGKCNLCTGPTPQQCLECGQGQYLDTDQKMCVPCTQDCLKCSNQEYCDVCAPGTYKSTQIQTTSIFTLCLQQCPAGTLPLVPSLYYLNKNLFTTEQLNQNSYQTDAESYPPLDGVPVAIISNGQSISSGFPWYITSDGIPLYQNTPIVLECFPCQEGCDSCAKDWNYESVHKKCYYQQCPAEYPILTSDGYCLPPPVDFQIQEIYIPSLTLHSGVHPAGTDLLVSPILQQVTNLADASYQWSLTTIERDYTTATGAQAGVLTTEESDKILENFWQTVKSNTQYLYVPASNLQMDIVYTLLVEVEYQGTKQAREQIVIVEEVQQPGSLEQLNICPGLTQVSPTQGFSGSTLYTASYIFGNIQIFYKDPLAFKFIIEIGDIQLSSQELSNQVNFIVPLDKENDQKILVTFRVRYQNQEYVAYRTVFAQANPNFDPTIDPILSQVSINSRIRRRILGGVEQIVSPQAIAFGLANIKGIVGTCTISSSQCAQIVSQNQPLISYLATKIQDYSNSDSNTENDVTQLNILTLNSAILLTAQIPITDGTSLLNLITYIQDKWLNLITSQDIFKQILLTTNEIINRLTINKESTLDDAKKVQFNIIKTAMSQLNKFVKGKPLNINSLQKIGNTVFKQQSFDLQDKSNLQISIIDVNSPSEAGSIKLNLDTSKIGSESMQIIVTLLKKPKEDYSKTNLTDQVLTDHLEIQVNNYDATMSKFDFYNTQSTEITYGDSEKPITTTCSIEVSFVTQTAPPENDQLGLFYLNPTTNKYEVSSRVIVQKIQGQVPDTWVLTGCTPHLSTYTFGTLQNKVREYVTPTQTDIKLMTWTLGLFIFMLMLLLI